MLVVNQPARRVAQASAFLFGMATFQRFQIAQSSSRQKFFAAVGSNPTRAAGAPQDEVLMMSAAHTLNPCTLAEATDYDTGARRRSDRSLSTAAAVSSIERRVTS